MAAAVDIGLQDLASWQQARQYLLRHTGVVLADDQSYLLRPRLGGIVKHHGCADIASFVAAATASPPTSALGMALIDALTTHETMFFRDPSFWKALQEKFLPPLLGECTQRGLRVWSAACSTGQEIYSFAMLLAECFPQHLEKATLHANDVSALAAERARDGVFSSLEVNRGLGALRLQRHFRQARGGFQINEAIRNRISFGVHNLLGAASCGNDYDIVLCRNVLIYFNETDKQAVVRRLFRSARPGGLVVVGATESFLSLQAQGPGLYVNDTTARML